MTYLLSEIWGEETSVDPFKRRSFAEKMVLSLLVISTSLSIRGLCARLGRARVVSTELYQAGILFLLLYLSIQQHIPAKVALALLTYIVYEIVGWSIFDVFIESKTPTLQGRRSELTSFLWATYSFLTIAWAYGLFYAASGRIVDSHGVPLPNIFAGVYFSVITITTIGYGDYSPAKDHPGVQLVIMSEPLVGLIVLALYFAVLMSAMSETFSRSLNK